MTDQASVPDYDYDVALSFAGEDRDYVRRVAELLQTRGVRVFYDEFMTADLWGNDLYVILDEVYRKKSRFTVIFASGNYARKAWTAHERQSAQARALNEAGAYLLPVRLDDSEVPGLRPTVAYVDARKTSTEELVELIGKKLARPSASPAAPISRSPRSLAEKARLLAERPDGWEYLLFAGTVFMGKQDLSSKLRDYELGYAPYVGPSLSTAAAAMDFVSASFDELVVMNATLMKLVSPDSQIWAFGQPGEAGDPERIEHLARRLVGSYESYLDHTAKLRGASVPSDFQHLLSLAADMTKPSVDEIGHFLDMAIYEADRILSRLKTGEPINIILQLTLTADADAARRYQKERKKLVRRFHL
jgi:TIR domain